MLTFSAYSCNDNTFIAASYLNKLFNCHLLLCEICTVRLSNKLAKHIDKVHKKSQCPHCGDMVKNLSFHLKQHVPNDERPLKCDKCGKGFFQKHILEEHSNVHTGAKPFKCKYCPSAFASRGTHAMHERGHLGIKRKPKKT